MLKTVNLLCCLDSFFLQSHVCWAINSNGGRSHRHRSSQTKTVGQTVCKNYNRTKRNLLNIFYPLNSRLQWLLLQNAHQGGERRSTILCKSRTLPYPHLISSNDFSRVRECDRRTDGSRYLNVCRNTRQHHRTPSIRNGPAAGCPIYNRGKLSWCTIYTTTGAVLTFVRRWCITLQLLMLLYCPIDAINTIMITALTPLELQKQKTY